MNKAMRTKLLAQPHRANPANPATADCAMWLSPDKRAARREQLQAQGKRLVGEVDCVCGNHTRDMFQ